MKLVAQIPAQEGGYATYVCCNGLDLNPLHNGTSQIESFN